MDAADHHKFTALHCAAELGHGSVVKQLLQAGAAVSAQTEDGATPLMWAAFSGSVACVQLLLEQGASVKEVDEKSTTPLHYATEQARGYTCASRVWASDASGWVVFQTCVR